MIYTIGIICTRPFARMWYRALLIKVLRGETLTRAQLQRLLQLFTLYAFTYEECGMSIQDRLKIVGRLAIQYNEKKSAPN